MERPETSILIVDDGEVNVEYLTVVLRTAGYGRLHATTDGRHALALFEQARPDIVLIDLHMPEIDGVEVLRRLRGATPTSTFLPMVILTADGSDEGKARALAAGANDYVTKPVGRTELLLRIGNLLETRRLSLEHRRQNDMLEARVRARTAELDDSRLEILQRLALAAEYRDDATGQHAHRVADLSARIALQMGMGEDDAELLKRAALLHDVGKIGIADEILLKPGRFTPEEFERMKAHTAIGGDLLAGSRSAVLQLAEHVARTHHERWDGNGYGDALSGEAIPLAGRIVAVADVFDALTSARSYKTAWTPAAAAEEIEAQRGRQFDPRVVDAFLAVLAQHSAPPCAPQSSDALITLMDELALESEARRAA